MELGGKLIVPTKKCLVLGLGMQGLPKGPALAFFKLSDM